MSNLPFRFKQFSIEQDQSAMKAGTDGVLLGAWCDVKNANQVLDIGTGTGLIALMIAQRNPDSNIEAVEISQSAAEQAQLNFQNSVWKDRLGIFHIALQNFKPKHKFNLIASNPPYFDSLTLSKKQDRNLARHTNELKFSELFAFGKEHLNEKGNLSLIFPAEQLEHHSKTAEKFGLFMNRLTNVYSKPDKLSRVLVSYSFDKTPPIINNLVIEESGRHQYSKEYIDLCKDFYLKM